MPIRERQCRNGCPPFEVFCRDRRGEYINLTDTVLSSEPTCMCGSTDLIKKVSTVHLIGMGGEASYSKIYPYYDRSLKMRISNAAMHKRIMKERGLEHYEPDDLEKAHAEEEKESERLDAWGKDYDDRLQNSPEFRSFREQRDKGAMTDHLPKHLQDKAKKSLGAA